ncbi:mycofactocin-coupled SDR family oxidoreductase [Sinomonas albida]|uniref:mycofactocin-coupled SDR family oxidoreductase n=1 Tax=Sinomonas albida TaxID=369942 RepID=UPI003018694A
MGRVDGKVAVVTGAARGLGRAFALRLAEEGADIVAIDIAQKLSTVSYELGSPDDLEETAQLVRSLGREVVVGRADVRDRAVLADIVAGAFEALGRIDIVCANAGIFTGGPVETISEAEWESTLSINVSGVFNTVQAAAPFIRRGDEGGSIIITSSAAAERALPNVSAYAMTKAAVAGLTRNLAVELSAERIRVNSVAPAIANTKMALSEASIGIFLPQLDNPSDEEVRAGFSAMNARPDTPWVEPRDVANAVLFLASEESRFVSGLQLKIDNAFSA